MIIHNDFREFQSTAEEIDKRLYYTNLIIKRGSPDCIPVNESGKITINDTKDVGYFGGELVHEAGHTVYDPVTAHNWVTCVYQIENELRVDQQTANVLAMIASDLVVNWKTKDDPVLRDYRKRSLEVIYRELYESADPVKRELFGIVKDWYGCGYEAQTTLRKRVERILKRGLTRVEKYVKLAKVFHRFMKKCGEDEECSISEDRMVSKPLTVDEEEAQRIAQRILMESKDFDEANRKLGILAGISSLRVTGGDELRSFFEAKARLVQMSIAFPMERTQKGVKVGSRRWRMEHGLRAIDVKRTVMKYGVSIPLVTTQTPRILQKFISSYESQKPCDLVVSIDTSGSTGNPYGTMRNVADYEVVMFYALVNLAKRLNQRIGLTLWAGSLYYTTLPETYDWRKSEELKKEILQNWRGISTNIIYALRQAGENRDKLFFVFTDGDVYYNHLIDADNVMFFLIKPSHGDYQAFVEKYGEGRVVKIDSLDRIPKVTVQQYVKLFME